MNIKNTKKGFTIVETLVAITILMIAIAGPLSIASKGLVAAITSRDQMIASNLVQESIEMVKNTRDNNFAAGFSWTSLFSGCRADAHCDASAIDSPAFLPLSGSSAYPLKITSANVYSHSCAVSCQATPFLRYFYLTGIDSSKPCNPADLECTLIVSVSWNEGSTPYQVLSSSELLNAPR